MNKSIKEFFHVLAIIFPLTLIIPNLLSPVLNGWQLHPAHPLAIFITDVVIVALAVFILLPGLNKLTSKVLN